jgi:deazaflavin-dependent oxidoreductase (nitroreductase family)
MDKATPRRSYFTPSPTTLAWITRIHRKAYRLTGGVIGAVLPQLAEPGDRWPLRVMHLLLLTTTGRKSGQARTVPLPYVRYDGRTFVIASFAGSDKHPAWFLNLKDQPTVEVQIGPRRRAARAVVVEGDDRARIWSRLTAEWPRYAVYQDQTERTIPLVEIV